MEATAKANGPLVRLAVRRALRAELGKKVSKKQVDDAMAHVGDAEIDHALAEAGVSAPGGGLVAWLLAHKDQIAAVVKIILAALGV